MPVCRGHSCPRTLTLPLTFVSGATVTLPFFRRVFELLVAPDLIHRIPAVLPGNLTSAIHALHGPFRDARVPNQAYGLACADQGHPPRAALDANDLWIRLLCAQHPVESYGQ